MTSSCKWIKSFEDDASDTYNYNINDTLNIVLLDIPYAHYTFNGQESGYHYDLVKEFAEKQNIKYSITYTSCVDSIYYYLENGICELAAYNINPPKGYYACGDTVYSVISITPDKETDTTNIFENLNNSTIHCTSKDIAERVKLYSEETGLNTNIILSGDNSEQLFTQLEENKINNIATYNYTVNMMRYEFPKTGKSYEISLPYKLSWCTKNKNLADSINAWYNSRVRKKTRIMYNYSYLATKGKHDFRYINKEHNIISNYDELFKKYAKTINWDWRLLAALSHTESNFDPEQISASGAIGLMQMMPVTSKAVNIPKENLFIPEDNLKICTMYISTLQKAFSDIKDKDQKIKFVLAAYNSGLGHVQDAMKLARKHHCNEQNWDHVVKYLLLKNDEKFYTDEVCKFGYFNGAQTNALVKSTLKTYELYKTYFK